MNDDQADSGMPKFGNVLSHRLFQRRVKHGITAILDHHGLSLPFFEFSCVAHVVYSPLILMYS